MIDNHLIFKGEDKYLETAGIQGDWPAGRGAYISDAKNFMVWINEEDHLRIIYLSEGANFNEIYEKWSEALYLLESNLKFAHDPKLGYLTSCPTNIGTAMRASVHLQL